MPFITIDTNARTEVTAEMLDELSEIAVRVLNKPKNYVTVKINSGAAILFGDTTENIGALVEFKSIGFGDKKAELARQLKDFAVSGRKAFLSVFILRTCRRRMSAMTVS